MAKLINQLISKSAHLLILMLLSSSLFSQSPQKMTYQCVVRNTSGTLMANKSVGIRITVLQGSPTGAIVYQESYSPHPQTNANGLVTLEIGGGTPITGTFSAINWSAGPYYLKTETDPDDGTNYTISGTSQLLTVPYSFYTNSAGNGFASVYTVDEKRPILNMTDGSVNIGTPPNNWDKLMVNGSVNIAPGTNNPWGSTLSLDARSQSGGLFYSIYSLTDAAGEGGGKFLIRNASGSSTFIMDKDGHTGINNIYPSRTLDVNGDINFTGSLLRNGNSFISPQGSVKVKGSETSMDSALFEVKNTTGQTIFAVYNEGVRIYVDDGVAKGATKGGFAIGSFDKSKGTSQPLFIVDPDSIRAYIAPNTGKAVKGGFAIGGFDPSKIILGEEYLRVTRDSSRIYVKNSAKGAKGGFAIGGFDPSKGGPITPFTSLTSENYFIGQLSGNSITTGKYNSVMGYEAGKNITTGNSNTFVGYQVGLNTTTGYDNAAYGTGALYYNTSGEDNTAIGASALYHNLSGTGNTALGFHTMVTNTSGTGNTAVGSAVLYSNTTGYCNTGIGMSVLYKNTIGQYNTSTGTYSLYYNTTGNYNCAYGYEALNNNTTGNYNIAIGAEALLVNAGSYNVAIGYYASALSGGGLNTSVGAYSLRYNNAGNLNNSIGAYTLYNNTGLYNSANGAEALYTSTSADGNTANGYMALYYTTTGDYNTADGIYSLRTNTTGSKNTALGDSSDVSTGALTNATAIGYKAIVNASNKVRIGNSSVTVIEGQVNWSVGSDRRLKDNIEYTDKLGLQFINNLRTVTFTYKNDSAKRHHDGLVAQDVKQTLEQLGLDFSGLSESDNEERNLNLSYAEFVVPLINSVKELSNKNQEQQKQIESQQKEIDELKSLVNSLVANQTGQGNK